jgi:hypothetical protein
MASLSLTAGALLRLDGGEAQVLALDFNRLFGGAGLQLVAVPGVASLAGSARLILVCPGPLRADTQDPEDALGGDLWEFQPSGPDAAYLRGLMSEMEMWLFDHPVNQHRVARGAPAITGLWLWGGGARLAALPRIQGWTAGNDPFFAAFAGPESGVREQDRRAGADGAPEQDRKAGAHGVREPDDEAGAADGAAAADRSRGTGEAGSGVVVLEACPGTPAWDAAESRWLRPALARLRSGALERLELCAGDWLFRVDAGWRWRIWRKTLPWWETLR